MTTLPRIALVGNPNAGKTALFNALTGTRQKTGNYAGVTVERHVGRMLLGEGQPAELIDLPGTYSLDATSPDEAVTRAALLGELVGEPAPDAVIVVVDAANLEQHLCLALEIRDAGFPAIIALNMVDMAERDGLSLSAEALSTAIAMPVVPTVAVRRRGTDALADGLQRLVAAGTGRSGPRTMPARTSHKALREAARLAASAAIISEAPVRKWTREIDRVLLHPVAGPLVLAGLLFLVFQAVFAWASPFADALEGGIGLIQQAVSANTGEGLLRSAINDGVLAGVGSVVVFLPQIILLFAFILVLENSGYMARAAFLMDRLMAGVGLSGRAFIPLLSSFACAVPGIMATRTIEDPRARLTTIMIAPLMTCSARLPVYAVIIAAFIPATRVGPGELIGLQGLVLFGLYLAGIVAAMLVALVFRRTLTKGATLGLMMELPKYQLPHLRDTLLGLWQRAVIFLKRAGSIIFVISMLLWLLLSFPKVDPASGLSQSEYSYAGRIGNAIEPLVAPIGFNHEIALALLPSMAAREVAVSSLATTYAIDATDEEAAASSLTERVAAGWSLPTALAFLVWFIFAPQCISTLAIARRETNSWRWPAFMLVYLFALAYIAAGATYWGAVALGL